MCHDAGCNDTDVSGTSRPTKYAESVALPAYTHGCCRSDTGDVHVFESNSGGESVTRVRGGKPTIGDPPPPGPRLVCPVTQPSHNG